MQLIDDLLTLGGLRKVIQQAEAEGLGDNTPVFLTIPVAPSIPQKDASGDTYDWCPYFLSLPAQSAEVGDPLDDEIPGTIHIQMDQTVFPEIREEIEKVAKGEGSLLI